MAKQLSAVCVLIFLSQPVFPWGREGHIIVNEGAIRNLPSGMDFFVKNIKVINRHIMNPDRRKSEDPGEGVRHWLDLEYFGKYPFKDIFSFDNPPMEQDYEERSGQLPWAIVEVLGELTAAMENMEKKKILLLTADLGHYVGDGGNPLHTTENYDGQWTGNRGIHGRFESGLIKRYSSMIKIDTFSVVYVKDPLSFVLEYLIESNSRISKILKADNNACWEPGIYDDYYYDRMWDALEELTNTCFKKAAFVFASLLYTARIDSGTFIKKKEK
ncbi:MAG: hypothetical protein ABIJ15_07305 [bacterium]